MYERKVELVAWLQNPGINWDAEDSASCGARGCFSEKNSIEIHEGEVNDPNYEGRKENIFKETSGRGHGAVLDQSSFVFSIDNLTRASTLFLCCPEYGAHLQQSLRRATAERGFHLPESLKNTEAEKLMSMQFELYSQMQSEGIPSEDARFILPLNTKTAIQTLWNARELMHLDSMSQRLGVPEETKDIIKQMIDATKKIAPHLMENRNKNYETLAWNPSAQLYGHSNKTLNTLISTTNDSYFFGSISLPFSPSDPDVIRRAVEGRDEIELSNLKHYHFTFLVPMSIATFHQAIRQRTWNQSIQTLEDATRNAEFITPPSIKKSKFKHSFEELNRASIKFVIADIENPDALGVLTHALKIYDLIHMNGWNAIHSLGKRTCTEAQWEIRTIAQKMATTIKEHSPELGLHVAPQGVIYGLCPEKTSCGLCEKLLKSKK